MIVICPNCTTRLQLEAEKVPQRAFSVRCPKCQHIITAQPPSKSQHRDAVAAGGDMPASTRPQQQGVQASAPSTPPQPAEQCAPEGAGGAEGEVLRMLASLLKREAGGVASHGGAERRRVLVCAGSAHGGEVIGALARSGYEVMVAESVSRAAELLREGNVSVVVLDPEFDVRERGSAFVCAELSSMRMPERRRVLFVHLSDSARTGDAHAAFLAGANLLVNTKDVRDLPRALERNLRDLNELYRDFNKALGAAAV